MIAVELVLFTVRCALVFEAGIEEEGAETAGVDDEIIEGVETDVVAAC